MKYNVIDVMQVSDMTYIIDTENILRCLSNNQIIYRNVKQMGYLKDQLVVLTLDGELHWGRLGGTMELIDQNVKSFNDEICISYTTYDTALKIVRISFDFVDYNLTELKTVLSAVTLVPRGVKHIISDSMYGEEYKY